MFIQHLFLLQPVVTEIVRIFKTTCDLDPASQTQKVLMNSSKLQKTCLNYFNKLISKLSKLIVLKRLNHYYPSVNHVNFFRNCYI